MRMPQKKTAGLHSWIRRSFRRIALEALFALVSFLVFVATLGKWKAWPRNSLALGYWSEGSDLDLTLYTPADTPLPRSLRVLWRMFRPFGEWAAYCGSDREWALLANPLEIDRDPRLAKLLLPEPRKPTPAEAFVFWLRMAGSDALLKDPGRQRTRERKWNFHREALERATGFSCQSAFPDFVDELGDRLAPIPRSGWAASEPWLQPHRWLGPALAAGGATLGKFAHSDTALLALARAQVEWEIWGLLGQVRLRQNQGAVSLHLSNLAGLFSHEDSIRSCLAAFRAKLGGPSGSDCAKDTAKRHFV